jgi:AcrR family transcriptional regulator
VDPETRFRAVFDMAYGPLCRYARHRGLDGPDAEDLVAQVLEVAWRKIDEVPSDDALPWLDAVAHNIWRNQARRDRRRADLLARFRASFPAQAVADPASPFDPGALRAALGCLSETGQEVRRRYVSSRDGHTTMDQEWTYIQPGPTEVVTAELIAVNYGSRTWFRGKTRQSLLVLTTGGSGFFNPAVIRAAVAAGRFKVTGTTMLRGIRVIKLAVSPGRITLYVDARTYMPVEYVVNLPASKGNWEQVLTEFQVLPASPANLARITPPVPAGFSRTRRAPGQLAYVQWTQ